MLSRRHLFQAALALPLFLLTAFLYLYVQSRPLRAAIEERAAKTPPTPAGLPTANAADANVHAETLLPALAARRRGTVLHALAKLESSAISEQPQSPARPPAPSGPNGNVIFEELLGDPAYAALAATLDRHQNDQRYARVYRELNPPPETLEKLKQLQVEQRLNAALTSQVLREHGIAPLSSIGFKATRTTTADLSQNIRELLGSDGWKKYQSASRLIFQQTAKDYAVSLQRRLSYSATPLSGAQYETTLILFSDAELKARTGRSGGLPPHSATLPATLIAQLERHLSPAQMQALEDIRKEREASATLQPLAKSEL